MINISINTHFLEPIHTVILGKIGSVYGIHGWIKIFSFTEKAESIFSYQPWLIKKLDHWEPIWLENWKCLNNQDWIIKIKAIQDREAVALLKNCKIFVESSQLPDLNEGEYYWQDLIGCRVITINSYKLGEVIDLIKTGSSDVLVVKACVKDAFGIKERLIPFLDDQVIKNVDLKTHLIEVQWDPDF